MKLQMRDLVTPAWALIGLGLVFGGGVALWEVFVSHSFATNDGLVWTLPLVTYIFLALTSTGVSIVLAYGLIKKVDAIISQTRALLVLAIGLLVGGFTALATELGSISNLIWILLSPNPTSPIWWMGTLYSIELLLLAIKLILDLGHRHGSFDRPLAWATLMIAIGAAITMGAVFGTVTARAGYAGSYASLLTLAIALASGTAAIMLTQPENSLTTKVHGAFRQCAAAVAVLLAVKMVYDAHSTVVALHGWADLWMVLLFALAAAIGGFVRRTASLLAIAGAFWVVYRFVVTGQLQALGPAETWFGAVQVYVPNLPELAVLVLGLSVAAALIKLGEQTLLESSQSGVS